MGLYDKVFQSKTKLIEAIQEQETVKSAIQPSKQFDEPVELEIGLEEPQELECPVTSEDEQDQSTLLTMDRVFTDKLNAGEFKTNADIPTHQERNEAYYQFRRARPGEYISFRDWMGKQTDPLAEAFTAVVSPSKDKVNAEVVKEDYRASMPPGLRELQDMNGVNQPKDIDVPQSVDTGQPDLFELEEKENRIFGEASEKTAEIPVLPIPQKGKFITDDEGLVKFVPDENGQWEVLPIQPDIKDNVMSHTGFDPYNDSCDDSKCVVVKNKDNVIAMYSSRDGEDKFKEEVLNAKQYFGLNIPAFFETDNTEYKVPFPSLIQEMVDLKEKPQPIHLVIKGDPTAQKRHRSVNMGKFTRQYDPSAADKADFLSIVQENAPEVPISSPIRLELKFYFARPKSHFGTGKKEGVLKDVVPHYHTARPDVDNCIKFCADSLNGIYWKDDSYIVECLAYKLYSENPRTEITITKL